jgi:hypothetical protein
MFSKRRGFAAFLTVLLLLSATARTFGQQWQVQLPVEHRSQQESWSCGPNNIAMWAGYIKKASFVTNTIADKYTGRDGTDLKEFEKAMYALTPYGYVFSDWAYTSKYTAIKGVMYSLARFNEPVVISGNNGKHYYLVVGGVASRNPYTNYGTQSNIQYLYLYDSRENSPIYTNPSLLQGEWRAWLSVNYWPVFKKGQRYTPDQVMMNWTRIGASGDEKWRSIERNTYAAWGSQGATYYNRATFFSY